MTSIKKFEDIEAWKLARILTNRIYEISNRGDFSRDFALRDQIRKAVISIMSNIAEGFESQTQALFITYLGRAKASAGEVRSQLYIALDQNYINTEDFEPIQELVEIISRKIYRFIKYLETQPNTRRIQEGKVLYEIIQ